jgi:hypothetical protein
MRSLKPASSHPGWGIAFGVEGLSPVFFKIVVVCILFHAAQLVGPAVAGESRLDLRS